MRGEHPMLRTQLLVWLLIPLTLLLSADAFFSYWIALRFSQRAYDRALVEIARDVALHINWHDGKVTLDLPDSARKLLFSDPLDTIYFGITTANGAKVEGMDIALPADAPVAESTKEILYDGRMNGTPVRIVQMPAAGPAATDHPVALVRIAETKNKREELAREILASAVIPQLLLILISVFLVWVGIVRGLSPLERVRQAVSLRSPHDWSPVVVSAVPGEVRPLLQSINELLVRLDGAHTLQSRFISDAAHQLKTPMAVILTQLEVAMREHDPSRTRESLASMRIGLDRLSRVISQILSLARNNPEAVSRMTMVAIDLNALALEASTNWVEQALKRRIDLGFEDANTPVIIRGDAHRLREVCDNLIDNAIRYSPEGGRVTVRVIAAPCPRLEVCDDSPRIPADERERVFERFHRLLGNLEHGSGLGLAIVKEIAHLHGADVQVIDDADGTGHVFAINFPAPGLVNPSS